MTSFCATTHVTPSLLTVFIITDGGAIWSQREGKSLRIKYTQAGTPRKTQKKKNWGDTFRFYGVSELLFLIRPPVDIFVTALA